MDFGFTKEQEAFRKEVKEFLKEHLTPDVTAGTNKSLIATPERRKFVDKIAKKGWLTLSWPKEYGGPDKPDPLMWFILNWELQYAGAPTLGKNLGAIGLTLMHHGSERVKKEFLPKILKNEIQWALVYTEPEAGSDLASLQTRAVLDGDHYVINGTKRFITSAHFGDWFWIAVRTDMNLPKHKGISLFILDAKTPGITIRAMYMQSGERTNEVYFDNVRVPKDYLVGELNRGWYYVSEALDYERFAIIAFAPVIRRFNDLVEWVKTAKIDGKPLKDDPVVRKEIARMAVRVEAGAMLERLCLAKAIKPEYVPNTEAAMNKIWGAEVGSDLRDVALNIAGPFGYLWQGSPYAIDDGEWAPEWTEGPHHRTAAAGVDVAKNILAKRLLRMPSV